MPGTARLRKSQNPEYAWPLMHLPPHQSIRISRIAPGEDAQAWAGAIATLDHEPTLTELKLSDTSAVWRADPVVAGVRMPVVAKVHALRGVLARAKQSFGQSKGHRQWRGAAWLAAQGFPTAQPLVLASGSNDQGPCECLLIEALTGWTVLDYLAAVDDESSEISEDTLVDIATAAGEGIGRMVSLKRYNRDHKPSNLIVIEESPATIAVIDTVAIRPAGSAAELDLVAMLKCLVLEPRGLGFEVPRWWLESACAGALGGRGHRVSASALCDAVETAALLHGNPRPEDVPIIRAGRRAGSEDDDSGGAGARPALD